MSISVTTGLLIAIIIVSAIGLYSRKFIERTVLRPYLIARGRSYETLVTSGFVHADLGHLIFNLLTFYSFGYLLERAIGPVQMIFLYLCGLLISNIGTVLKHRNDPNYAALGASGAILAVLFASIVYFPTQKLFILPIPIPIPAPLFALGYLAFSYYSSNRRAAGPGGGRINHDAHIFGALTGLAYVLITNPEQFRALLNLV